MVILPLIWAIGPIFVLILLKYMGLGPIYTGIYLDMGLPAHIWVQISKIMLDMGPQAHILRNFTNI